MTFVYWLWNLSFADYLLMRLIIAILMTDSANGCFNTYQRLNDLINISTVDKIIKSLYISVQLDHVAGDKETVWD